MLYRVKIKRPNKMFNIKNKQVRSPFECTVNDLVLSQLKVTIRFYGLQESDYEIQQLDSNQDDKKKDYSYIPSKQTEPPVAPKTKNLDELQNKNVKKQEPIQKIFKHDLKPVFVQKPEIKLPLFQKPKIDSNVTSVEEPKQNNTNTEVKTEQNINVKPKQVVEEVKIEELTSTASTLLDKFLHSEL